MGKQGSVQRCWPEHLSPPTGSSQGRVSLAEASRRVAPRKLHGRLRPMGPRVATCSGIVWSVLAVPQAVRMTGHWGEDLGSNSKARGIKEGSRLQLHPGLAPDSVASFLINHLMALKETSCGICSKNVIWKIYLLQIITATVSGHLSLSGTVPNAFHAFIPHSVLSATQWRKVPLFTVLHMRLNRARTHTQTLNAKCVLFITRLLGLLPSLPSS